MLSSLETDRNLLIGVLALQAGLIDSKQFVEVCALWTTTKETSLIELLVERGWIRPDDVAPIEYLLRRNLEQHGGEAGPTLTIVEDEVKRQLVALNDPEIQGCLTKLASEVRDLTVTLDVPLALQRYTRMRLHATGGIGQIWVARDRDLGREIALKELRSDKARSSLHSKRFLREARITAQLAHPGIVPVYELAWGAGPQQPFYTMRLVNGRTLTEAARAFHERRAGGQADSLEFLALLSSFVVVCNTIAYAHSRGVIHRDLKGQNVLLGDFGEVVVLDWGLAKVVDGPEQEEMPPMPAVFDQLASEDTDLTVEGQMIGTPAYMAPEQAAGFLNLIDRRADVYGLGAILYEILTGTRPFIGVDAQEVLRKVREQDPIPPREVWSDVPPALETTCLRALSKKAGDRHGSATELAHEVQQWQEVQRKHAEEERDRFFNLSVDMLCVAGFDGYLKRVNSSFSRILGFTTEEMRAEPFLNFVHPDDQAATIAEVGRLEAGMNTIFFENRYRCKDGSYRWMQWCSAPDFEQGLIYAVARDVTEPKLTQEALGESEERYRSVIAAMQDGIVILDDNGSIRACNTSAERILGLSAEQMMGRTSLDPRWQAIHEDGSPFPGDTFPAAVTLRTGQPCSNVVMGVHKPNGDLTWISINSQPLFRPAQRTLAGVVASFTDITANRQTENLLKETTMRLAEANRHLQNLPASQERASFSPRRSRPAKDRGRR
jgi:PAS domain S-box-containing protein